jgi:shikimate kinase
MGSGKSVVGALVAAMAGSPFHDLDLMVEDEAGMEIPDIFRLGARRLSERWKSRCCRGLSSPAPW